MGPGPTEGNIVPGKREKGRHLDLRRKPEPRLGVPAASICHFQASSFPTNQSLTPNPAHPGLKHFVGPSSNLTLPGNAGSRDSGSPDVHDSLKTPAHL